MLHMLGNSQFGNICLTVAYEKANIKIRKVQLHPLLNTDEQLALYVKGKTYIVEVWEHGTKDSGN
jgi:hypothetical protein